MSDDLVFRLRKRAEIRRQIATRKSVQNNEPDRISDLLEEAADRIAELEKEKWLIEIEAKRQSLKQIIDWLKIEHDTLACSSYPMSKNNRAIIKEITG